MRVALWMEGRGGSCAGVGGWERGRRDCSVLKHCRVEVGAQLGLAGRQGSGFAVPRFCKKRVAVCDKKSARVWRLGLWELTGQD